MSRSTSCTELPLCGARALAERRDQARRFLGRVGKAEGLTCRSCALGFDDAALAVQRVALANGKCEAGFRKLRDRHEAREFLEPVLDDDEFGRGRRGRPALGDHQEPAIRSEIVVSASR